jgi:hypothetical protein
MVDRGKCGDQRVGGRQQKQYGAGWRLEARDIQLLVPANASKLNCGGRATANLPIPPSCPKGIY